MKECLFKLFKWRLEIKLSKKKDDERILFLANRLFDEVEAQGYNTASSVAALKSFTLYLLEELDPERNFHIDNTTNKWSIRGRRG